MGYESNFAGTVGHSGVVPFLEGENAAAVF